MPTTLNVADKPTLNSVKTDTDTLITRGGIRHNGTNPQVYDTTNDTWVDLPSGGSLSPTIIIKNHFYQDGDMDNLDITVTEPDTGWTTTQNMGTADKMIIAVPWFDEYELTCTFQQEYLDWKINVPGVGGVDGKFIPKIVSWSTGTDQEIADLVKWADRGVIDLATDAGWAVGDSRPVHVSTIPSSGTFDNVSWSVNSSCNESDVSLILVDIGSTSETGSQYSNSAATSYELVQPVKNKDGSTRTNPSFLVGLSRTLYNSGGMNSTATNIGSWESSYRRPWCNGGFRQALPSSIRSIFKQINVVTAKSYNGTTNQITQDYFALMAAGEVFGGQPATSAGTATSYSTLTEFNALVQFEYYKTETNRIKAYGQSSGWWLRSPYYNSSNYFCMVSSNYGTASSGYASSDYFFSPFGAI